MTRQQLPPQIKRLEVLDRKTGKTVVRYQVTADAGTDPITGRRRQVRRRFNTEREARDEFGRITNQASTGTFVPRKAVTVDQLCEDWLSSLHNARATTMAGYEFVLAPLCEQHGSMPVQKLSRSDLDRLLIALRDGGTVTAKGSARRPWSPRSLNQAINAWRLVLAYGIERRELSHNAAAGMRRVPSQRREMATYTPEEVGRVLQAADDDRNGHLWYLALSGLRRAEVAGLRWDDIDFAAGTLTVARGRVEVGTTSVVVEGEPKTVSSRRTLPLDEGLMAVLRRAKARQAQEKLAVGAGYADSGYVAANEAGQPYTPGALTHMWGKLTMVAGVRRIRLHDARHTAGTAMHLRGVPMAVVAKWLGHTDASFTARIYAHSQDDELRAAGQTLGAVVTSGQIPRDL